MAIVKKVTKVAAKPEVKEEVEETKTNAPTMKLKKTAAKAPVDEDVPSLEAETKTSAKAKPAKAKAEAVEETEALESTDDLIASTSKTIENLKEDKAFKMVPQLLDNIDHDYFRLGGVLSVIQSQGWYMDKQYENFRSYVENECGIAYRKSMYLIGIYNGLVESGVPWVKVKNLGWTKLKELASILTPENVDEWVGIAENMTVLQLQEHIKSKAAGTENGDEPVSSDDAKEDAKKTTTMTFKLHTDQKATIREALDKAKHQSGTEYDSVALEMISLDYLGSESKVKHMPTLEELMKSRSPEEILTTFGELFPDIELEASLPDDGEQEAE